MKPYHAPILVTLLRIIAGLYALGSVLVVIVTYMNKEDMGIASSLGGFGFFAVPVLVVGALVVVVILGIAQVIDFLGRTAYHTEATATAVQILAAGQTRAASVPTTSHKPTTPSGQHSHNATLDSQDPDIAAYLKAKAEREKH